DRYIVFLTKSNFSTYGQLAPGQPPGAPQPMAMFGIENDRIQFGTVQRYMGWTTEQFEREIQLALVARPSDLPRHGPLYNQDIEGQRMTFPCEYRSEERRV